MSAHQVTPQYHHTMDMAQRRIVLTTQELLVEEGVVDGQCLRIISQSKSTPSVRTARWLDRRRRVSHWGLPKLVDVSEDVNLVMIEAWPTSESLRSYTVKNQGRHQAFNGLFITLQTASILSDLIGMGLTLAYCDSASVRIYNTSGLPMVLFTGWLPSHENENSDQIDRAYALLEGMLADFFTVSPPRDDTATNFEHIQLPLSNSLDDLGKRLGEFALNTLVRTKLDGALKDFVEEMYSRLTNEMADLHTKLHGQTESYRQLVEQTERDIAYLKELRTRRDYLEGWIEHQQGQHDETSLLIDKQRKILETCIGYLREQDSLGQEEPLHSGHSRQADDFKDTSGEDSLFFRALRPASLPAAKMQYPTVQEVEQNECIEPQGETNQNESSDKKAQTQEIGVKTKPSGLLLHTILVGIALSWLISGSEHPEKTQWASSDSGNHYKLTRIKM